MSKYWKEASSLILACRMVFSKPSKFIKQDKRSDFKILVLKRGKTTDFFPGGHVFPGGVCELNDASDEWLTLFKDFGFQSEDLISDAKIDNNTSIFDDRPAKLSKAVALRITAIRETFEECGVLLCKPRHNCTPSFWTNFFSGFKVHHWQKKVQNNSNEFLNMCHTLECLPDIWSLHQWSNWLSPTNMPKRYDTAFFVATLNQMPPSYMNPDEMDDIKWYTPEELINGSDLGGMWLPPPQYYEMSRISHFQKIDMLNNFAVKRTLYGCERWMPYQITADDGVVAVLPGDEMYPDNVDIFHKTSMGCISGRMEDLRKDVHKIHRMELYGQQGVKILISRVKSSTGHVLP